MFLDENGVNEKKILSISELQVPMYLDNDAKT